jgi:hypothetical protein
LLQPRRAVRGLDAARAAGVEALCYACRLGVDGIEIEEPLAVAPSEGAARAREQAG